MHRKYSPGFGTGAPLREYRVMKMLREDNNNNNACTTLIAYDDRKRTRSRLRAMISKDVHSEYRSHAVVYGQGTTTYTAVGAFSSWAKMNNRPLSFFFFSSLQQKKRNHRCFLPSSFPSHVTPLCNPEKKKGYREKKEESATL